MLTKDFDYHLPPELIAQRPAPRRELSRLMLVRRAGGEILHYRASDLPSLLRAGDLMVLNDTRVIPARIFGRKRKTGGKAEILFIEEREKNTWEVLLHSSGRSAPGDILLLAGDKMEACVKSTGARGRALLELRGDHDLMKILEEEGLPPLPPYIKRTKNESAFQRQLDRERYQTVYAKTPGAIAAPTAGLHLSNELLAALEKTGVQRASVTLHVGPGTFVPVRSEKIAGHKMESERFIILPEAAAAVNNARAGRRRIVAVGTTVVRALESAAGSEEMIAPGRGRTDIFIHPPYCFKIVSALLTNFHLPRSTLLMLVSAFAGRALVRRAYEIAVREKYRFYSYGDCMLIV
ncbi:MAG: tRNA preQ1(34) S-adenosylmethionine ribosyltransferase-isomerase QueA [Kiritimatiellae bacterium]|nr:tRNA preQ1(34) S-adenosylmethionine ribosyltransferase-isomerase QueA [Kiritimatiellia bacterium]